MQASTLVSVAVLFMALQTVSRAAYFEEVRSDQPVAYWRFGENDLTSPAIDEAIHSLDGTYVGGVMQSVSGAIPADRNTAVLLDGETGFISVAATPLLNQLQNELSIEAWIRPYPSSEAFRVVSTRSPDNSGWGLTVEADGRLNFTTFGVRDHFSRPLIDRDVWTHVVVTFESGNLVNVFVNGTLADSIAASGNARTNDAPLNIGREPFEDFPGRQSYFSGLLDEVAIFDRALSPHQVATHFAASQIFQPGDTDADGDVDLTDLNNVRNHFGDGVILGPPVLGEAYPFNGLVDLGDLNLVRNAFGTVSPEAVPEPAAFSLALFFATGSLAAEAIRRHYSSK